jgi:hypothetical protein
MPDGNTLTELSFPKLEKAAGLKIYGKKYAGYWSFPPLGRTNDLLHAIPTHREPRWL